MTADGQQGYSLDPVGQHIQWLYENVFETGMEIRLFQQFVYKNSK